MNVTPQQHKRLKRARTIIYATWDAPDGFKRYAWITDEMPDTAAAFTAANWQELENLADDYGLQLWPNGYRPAYGDVAARVIQREVTL